LWFRPLSQETLLEAVLGSAYIIIGLGLFGQSRFSLFMAILVSGVMASLAFDNRAETDILSLRVYIDTSIVALSVIVLWCVRNRPSI